MLGVNLKILGVVLGTLIVYTALANMIPQLESEVPQAVGANMTPEQLVAAGEELYQSQCTQCHGLGERAPNLLTDEKGTGLIGARCQLRRPGLTCKEYLHESMVKPNAYVAEGYAPIMPDMSRTLSPAQIYALVAYLESTGGTVSVTPEDIEIATTGRGTEPPTPPAPTGAATATAGADPQSIIQAQNCLACHKIGDQGGTIGPDLTRVGAMHNADYIRRSLLEPNADTAQGYAAVAGTMPANLGQQLTAAQLEALVRYLVARK